MKTRLSKERPQILFRNKEETGCFKLNIPMAVSRYLSNPSKSLNDLMPLSWAWSHQRNLKPFITREICLSLRAL